jgi:hypothetical protein
VIAFKNFSGATGPCLKKINQTLIFNFQPDPAQKISIEP